MFQNGTVRFFSIQSSDCSINTVAKSSLKTLLWQLLDRVPITVAEIQLIIRPEGVQLSQWC